MTSINVAAFWCILLLLPDCSFSSILCIDGAEERGKEKKFLKMPYVYVPSPGRWQAWKEDGDGVGAGRKARQGDWKVGL